MTQSNDYHLVPIDDIVVGERYRKDYGDIGALAASIDRFGLLHPIVIDRENRLLAGGRRLSAVKSLGKGSISCHYIDEVDNLHLREIELEENLSREDLTWQEEARLIKAIDDLKRTIHGSKEGGRPVAVDGPLPSWSLRRTGEELGISQTHVQTNIRLANALDIMPSLAQQTSKTNALRALDRLEEDLVNELERRQRNKEAYAKLESSVLCGDALQLIESLATDSIDCIITDPPYGVDVGHGGGHREEADFDDSPEAAMAILRSLAPQMFRVLKPSGHFYCFFAPQFGTQVVGILSSAGFDIRPVYNIWVKPGGATGTGDWDHNFAASWEPFLFASNRQRRLAFKRKNVFTYQVDLGNARHHPTQKPVELIRELIQESTDPDQIILDPFAGSGTTLVAASQLRRKFIGFELSQHYHQVALKRLVDEGSVKSYVPKAEF